MSENNSTSGRRTPDIDSMSGAYVLNALTDQERQDFEIRLSESDELRTEVTELNDTVLLMAHAVEPVTPSAGLRSSIMGLLDSTPQLPTIEKPVAEGLAASSTKAEGRHASDEGELLAPTPLARQRWFMRPGVMLVGAAAAVGLVFGGVAIGNQTGPQPSQSQFADGVSQIYSAADVQHKAADVSTGGKATLYWSNSLKRSAVILDGVSSLPSSKTYQLWYIRGGKATSAGTVSATSNSVTAELQGDMSRGDTVGVTVEPAGGSKAPTTKPIVALQGA